MAWLAVAVAVLVGLLAILGAWAYQTANRLDRLHVRYDLSWQALDGALARRAVVARAVAIDAYGGAPGGRRLAALADAAEAAPRQERESRENELSAALAIVDPAALPAGLIAELADAEARVVLARRFHNDAVRDTLALRERFLVRTLRLGGTAALPSYFEIVERPHALAHGDVGSFNGVLSHRTSARVVLLDERGAVLLLRGSDPAIGRGGAPKWWITVGGEVQKGERLAEAATRELAEETGLQVAPGQMVGPVWRRDEVFEFNGSLIDSEEFYFVYRTQRFEPSGAGRTDLERSYIHGHRWCDAADIAALAATGETVYPTQLAELLPDAAALAGGRAPGPLMSIR
ncbi:exopolyphosphatase [Mycobacterium paraffinicum]|uniref:Exopolyphosphatase n=1 Tax=Mycobacterium paraffinicum TaxID=53378 RepID=A0A1Q4HPD1_9MYCO|nr:NUDIX domain-containing protein [Mycobacterium paraffinicum]OJZ69713.1 exopolyphosphatase [Mycobacterium paraffinicum]